MSQSVIKCNQHVMEKMKDYYSNALVNKNIPGSLFVAKLSGCTVTAYRSGKVLFQGKSAETEAKKWGTQIEVKARKSSTSNSVTQHQFLPPAGVENLAIIGSDEVGTGDYFGPMTVAAAYTSHEDKEMLSALGVTDSKLLTDKKILQMAQTLISRVTYSLLILPNEKYNELQKRGYSQGKMKAILHNQALQNVISKLKGQHYDGILVDQFAKPHIYFNYLKDEPHVVNNKIYFQTKAESIHLSVAIASIIARYAFLKEMDRLSEKTGVTLPKGAGPHVDVVASSLIKERGLPFMNQIAKLHFANTEKAQKL